MKKDWYTFEKECKTKLPEGYTLLGWHGDWHGCLTKILIKCPLGHKRDNLTIARLKREGVTCKVCSQSARRIRNKENSSKKYSTHIDDFFAAGVFPEGTIFGRGSISTEWFYYCPTCANDPYSKIGKLPAVFRGAASSFKKGYLSCRCSSCHHWTEDELEFMLRRECRERKYRFVRFDGKISRMGKFSYLCKEHGLHTAIIHNFINGRGCPHCGTMGQNQKECYIHAIFDQGCIIGLKFGIATDSSKRLNVQNKNNLFQMQSIGVYSFSSTKNCRAAERACKLELDCGLFTKREICDGFTETTSTINYDKIVEIYERFGGKKVE